MLTVLVSLFSARHDSVLVASNAMHELHDPAFTVALYSPDPNGLRLKPSPGLQYM